MLGCATENRAAAKSSTLTALVDTGEPADGPAVEVDLSQGIFANKEDGRMHSWFGYAVTRRQWRLRTFHQRFGAEAAYQYTFDEEVEARTNASLIWTEMGAQKRRTDPYFADVEVVRDAGFMREYVWACVPHSKWTEPAGLRLSEFVRWMSLRLARHRVETWVRVIPGTRSERWIVGAEAHRPGECDLHREPM